jgi:hypothetical protein
MEIKRRDIFEEEHYISRYFHDPESYFMIFLQSVRAAVYGNVTWFILMNNFRDSNKTEVS